MKKLLVIENITYVNKGEKLEYEKVFVDEDVGVVLTRFNEHNRHVVIRFVLRDVETGHWHTTAGFLSGWVPYLEEKLAAAEIWMRSNCVQSKGGWRFKS